MKTSKKRSLGARADERTALLGPVTASFSAALLMAAGSVQAADQPATGGAAEEPELVVITGIRAAIEDAIAKKKKSDSVIEAVSAEDIGKLPDTSIAESIARLPGLAAQRTDGRAKAISVRGFAPDFTTALLNGREQASTGDSRFVEFDQYPSELLNGLTVYKTPDGDLVGQGLSATIDMATLRPLSLPKRAAAVNYRKVRLGEGLKTPASDGSRINLFYADQLADHTLGLAVAYARLKENAVVTTNFGSWGINDVCPVSNNNGCNDAGGAPVATLGRAPGGFNDLRDTTFNKREAFMGTLQYKPNEAYSSTLDYFYSKFDISVLEQGVQMPLAPAYPDWGQNYGGVTVVPTTTAGGVITAGSMAGFKALSRNDSDATHDKVRSLGWNNTFNFGDSWTGILDLATSKADRVSAHIETTAGIAGNCRANPAACPTVSWTGFDGNSVTSAQYSFSPTLGDASVMKLTDVEGWGGNLVAGASTTPQAGYSKQPITHDKLNAYRLSFKHQLGANGMFSSYDFGVNYADRDKDRAYIEGRMLVAAASDPFAAVSVPGAVVGTGPTTGLDYLAWNPDGSIGSIYQVASKLQQDIANKNWTVHEKVATAFSKLNLQSTLWGKPLHGNIGLQIVRTEQQSTAFTTDGSPCPGDVCALGTTTRGATYYDFLPSINLVSDLGSDQFLRFGLGRQMARSTLNDMRASTRFSLNTQTGTLTGDAGDPTLKPFRANALDLSYEKYFAGSKGYVSVAGFYKDLQTYVVKSISSFDFAPYVIPGVTPLPTNGSTVGTLIRPTNGNGGNVSGIELTASIPFSLMTDRLEGFGLQASYSYTESSVKLPLSGVDSSNITLIDIPLPGLSKNVNQLTLYYERFGFSVRLGRRYRSNFIGNIVDFAGDDRLVFVKAEAITDAQAAYEFKHGPLKGLSLLFQANNIGNAPYVEYRDNPSDETNHKEYGKTYLFGINYRL